jgi:predicted transcriptional regulator
MEEVEKGKTAKYLREKLGGIPEQAKENLKEFNGIKKLMLEALKEQDLTVKQMSEKINMPTDQVMYYLMSLVKYGFVITGDIDDMDEYYTYKLNK